VSLFHYALRTRKAEVGSWHLYGPQTRISSDDPNARSIDVDVDCNDFYPFAFEEVAQHMLTKHYQPVGCHVSDGTVGSNWQ